MNFKIESVLERDIDLLMINKFINDPTILNIFLEKLGLLNKNYHLVDIEHSYSDKDGESDITLIIDNNINKYGILIEDKINAEAMDNQAGRYKLRGNTGIKQNKWDDFFVFIIAPEEYLKINDEADKYKYNISYEKLREYMIDDLYAKTLFDFAIEKKPSIYVMNVDEIATALWNDYYKYIVEKYPNFIVDQPTPKGYKSSWFYFKTGYPKINIIHKIDDGLIDLSFEQMTQDKDLLEKYGLITRNLGQSQIIRKVVPRINKHEDFNKQIDKINECLKAVDKLYSILKSTNINKMKDELNHRPYDFNKVQDFIDKYHDKHGILINYDKRVAIRAYTGNLEQIAKDVKYPNIQRYQTGEKSSMPLFIIYNNSFNKLERINEDKDSNYRKVEPLERVSDEFFEDDIFNQVASKPVSINREELLEIED